MTRSQAIQFFGGKAAVAHALKISYAAVQQWGDEIPLLRQHQLEKITMGQLTVGPTERTDGSEQATVKRASA